jgi:hypothetical protein
MRTRLLLTLLAFAALGCASGTETGNPSLNASLSFSAHSSKPDAVAVREGAAPVLVSAVWLSLGPVALVEGEDCSASSPRFESAALGVGNHAAAQPGHTDVSAEASSFCALELEFTPSVELPQSAPTALSGRSIAVAGELADGAPFLLVSGFEGRVAVPAVDTSFALSEAQAAMLLGFDLAAWLEGIDLDAVPREDDGSIVIDAERTPELVALFDAALPVGLELYRDRDGDGRLDENPELLARGSP